MGNKKHRMRKWQQNLGDGVQEVIESVELPQEASQEKTWEVVIKDVHLTVLVFVGSALILYSLKPALVTRREKERPEESARISYVSLFLISAIVSIVYLCLLYKVVAL